MPAGSASAQLPSAWCWRRGSAVSPSTSRRRTTPLFKRSPPASETGPATVILAGTASGMESSVYAVLAIAIAIGAALALGGGNLQFSFYLVALCGMGMLATTGVIVSEDTFGPVSDNAAGIAEMSGEFHGEPARIMVSLDAVGNTTKAVTKGFAIGSAVIAAVALFASFIETAVNETQTARRDRRSPEDVAWRVRPVADQRRRPEGVHRSADRWRSAVPVQLPRHPRRRPHRRRRGAGGPQAVRRRQDHEGREGARVRPGHRHLHRGVAARVGHPGAARRPHSGDRRLRHQLLRTRGLPCGRHPGRPVDGQLPVELRRFVGQRQEVHRGRPPRRQGQRPVPRRRHRRHRRRPLQGHCRTRR